MGSKLKASKGLYSTCFKEYKLNEDDQKRLQHELLGMFLDIKKVCDDNDIDYMMSGGTLLGTIRHKGFIPWDDDIDIMMVRSEYEKFRTKFNQRYSDKYTLAEPTKTKNFFFKMPKVYKKGTTYIEIPYAGIDGYNMLFVDIFIIENIPNSALIRKIKAKIYDFAYKGASVCIDYKYPSPPILEKSKDNKELSEYYKFRRKMGSIFNRFGGLEFYLKICEKVAKSKKSKYMGIPSGFSYEREIFPAKVFTELEIMTFCGYEVKIPKNYDVYLKNLYGNYMEIPPVEKRELHVAYEINY